MLTIVACSVIYVDEERADGARALSCQCELRNPAFVSKTPRVNGESWRNYDEMQNVQLISREGCTVQEELKIYCQFRPRMKSSLLNNLIGSANIPTT